MARRYGQSSLSSLISSARASAAKRENLEDQLAAYEYDLSAKTPEDFARYAERLTKRLAAVQNTDASKALEIQKKITSAQRAYTSSEISRASMNVNYGKMTDRDKYNKLAELYGRAIENGDENLAQRLEAQAATLSMKIQNAGGGGGRGGGGGGSGSTASKKGYDKSLTEIERAIASVERARERGTLTDKEFYQGTRDDPRGISELYNLKRQILEQASQDPNVADDARATYDYKRQELEVDNKYRAALDRQSYAARFKQGEDPTIAKYDKYGNLTFEDKKVVARTGGDFMSQLVNEKYTPNADSLRAGNDGQFVRIQRKFGNETQDVLIPVNLSDYNPQLKGFGSFLYATDPGTGKQYVISGDGEAKEFDLSKPETLNSQLFADASTAAEKKGSGLGASVSNLLGMAESKRKFNEFNAFRATTAQQLRALGREDLAKQAEALGLQNSPGFIARGSGAFAKMGNYKSEIESLLRIAQAEDASRKALAALPKALPSAPTPTINWRAGTVQGSVGPRAIPAPVVKASNQPGTKEFTARLIPGFSNYEKIMGR